MKKSALQKPIKAILEAHGFKQIKNEQYAMDARDRKTKLILKIPTGKNGNGFVLGAQFADFGEFDGLLNHAALRQYDFAYELAYPESCDYTAEQIEETVRRLLDAYQVYIDEGARAIREHLDCWTFGDLSDAVKDAVQRYFDLPGIDPYSEEYQKETADRMRNGGSTVIPLSEYREHRDFYDGYRTYHADIRVDEEHDRVTILFSPKRETYQQ